MCPKGGAWESRVSGAFRSMSPASTSSARTDLATAGDVSFTWTASLRAGMNCAGAKRQERHMRITLSVYKRKYWVVNRKGQRVQKRQPWYTIEYTIDGGKPVRVRGFEDKA